MIDITFLECLVIISIYIMITYISGPFNLISRLKNYLILNIFLGSFFYKLFSCSFCIGFWSGIVAYLMSRQDLNVLHAVMFGLAGSSLSFMAHIIFESLDKEDDV